MIKPKALKAGDVVGVVAPSDAVEKKDVEKSKKIIESWGLKVKIGKHVYAKVGDFSAGTAEERMEDMLTMINDDDVKAVWAAGGGYAATEIMPAFSKEIVEKLKSNLKWFLGYSDVCLFLNALASYRMVSVLGPNMSGLWEWDHKSQEGVRRILMGEDVVGVGPEARWKPVLPGVVEGRLLVSNLELLFLSFGSRFDPLMYGEGDIILGIEELDIDKSSLQRQIDTVLAHKRANRIKGMFVGRLTNILEVSYPVWGRKVTAEGLVVDRLKKFGIPLAFLDDFGHPEWSYGILTGLKKYFYNRRFISIPNGIKARLAVKDKECNLEYLEKISNDKDGELQPRENVT